VASFIDRVKIEVEAGAGGRGCMSFRREKYVPRGGPDGGDGGHGGSVVLVGDSQVTTLLDFSYRRHYQGERGAHGQGANKRGRDGATLRLRVPLGTIATTDDGERLGEIVRVGAELVIARGGRGGRGNTAFKSATNQAPRRADPGGEGESRRVILELKLLADAGLVGKPNAGKSTLLAALSAATPEIAAYPFTTRSPVLGVVRVDDDTQFVLADIPGLLEGAHEGRGLGLDFLRHVERTRTLVLVLDTSADVEGDYRVLVHELDSYAVPLAERRRVIALNKVDLMDEARISAARAALPAEERVFCVSGLARTGLTALVNAVAADVADVRRHEDVAPSPSREPDRM